MSHRPSRRAFFEARLTADSSIRPPGSDPDTFRDRCTRCGDCAAVCEQAIIDCDDAGYPVLNFKRECTFCGACAEICSTHALDLAKIADWPWRARVTESCFAAHGIACRSCQDECESSAIRFRPVIGGVANPSLDQDSCIGCGACAAICPAGAISFERNEATVREAVS